MITHATNFIIVFLRIMLAAWLHVTTLIKEFYTDDDMSTIWN